MQAWGKPNEEAGSASRRAKSVGELAVDARLHQWIYCRRTSLAYAFLLKLMRPPWEGARVWIWRTWCHRTDAWTCQTLVPFTR